MVQAITEKIFYLNNRQERDGEKQTGTGQGQTFHDNSIPWPISFSYALLPKIFETCQSSSDQTPATPACPEHPSKLKNSTTSNA